MRREDRTELQAREQGPRLVGAAFLYQAAIGAHDVVGGVLVVLHRNSPFPVAQLARTIVLLADVGEVEVGRKGAGHQRHALHRQVVDQRGCSKEGLLGGFRGSHLGIGGDGLVEQRIEGRAQLGIVLVEHASQQSQEERHVLSQGIGHVHSLQARTSQLVLVRTLGKRVCHGFLLVINSRARGAP